MHLHVNVLGWLHFIWGVLGALVGASLLILALGTNTALRELGSFGAAEHAAVWLFVICGLTLVAAGGVMMLVARALARRRAAGRVAALVLAVPNLVIVPFGTALGIYAFWVLLNDDARREFGRPPRSQIHVQPLEGA
jgi:hypothetical protein